MTILDGKAYAAEVKQALKEEIARTGEKVTLAVVLVGDDPASQIYVANKVKACAAVGINSVEVRLPADIGEEKLLSRIRALNEDDEVDGIMVQLPLPKGKGYHEDVVVNTVAVEKDVDALTYKLQGQLSAGGAAWAPCTPQGVIGMLEHYGVPIEGKNAVVIGRSKLCGKPLALLLLEKNATVTICHSHTQNLCEITQKADIIAVCVGKPNFLTANMVKQGAVVVDVGISRTQKGICGDVAFEEVAPKCSYISPVPGGVGPVTIAMLLANTLTAHRARKK